MTFALRLALAAAIAASSAPAFAADYPHVTIRKGVHKLVSGYQIGTLRCTIDGGVGYVVGSRRDATCEYRPTAGRNAVDLYIGRIDKAGLDIGATGPSVMAWAVIAHSTDLGPGDLAGKYRGASAAVSALIGGGANVLIGGSDATISLQPLSFEGQTGLSLAAGYASLRLDPI